MKWSRNKGDNDISELLPPDVSFVIKSAATSMVWGTTPEQKAAFERGVQQIRAAFLSTPAGDESLDIEEPTPVRTAAKTTDPPSQETLNRLRDRPRQEPTYVRPPNGGAVPIRDEAPTVVTAWRGPVNDDEIVDAEIIEEG